MEAYEKWLKDIETLRLPRYEDLSNIPLYLDQILEYINDALGTLFVFDESILTQAMINNYVKQKAVPAPIKKRYDKEHMVYIIAITILKQIMNIQYITKGSEVILSTYGVEDGYNMFIDYVEESMRFTLGEIYGSKRQFKEHREDVLAIPLKAATLAFAGKIFADYSFKNLLMKQKDDE